MAEAVTSVFGIECAIQEQETRRERIREVILRWIQHSFFFRTEAANGRTERETHLVGRKLRVVFGHIRRQRRALGPVYRGLCPFLGVPPWRWTGMQELN